MYPVPSQDNSKQNENVHMLPQAHLYTSQPGVLQPGAGQPGMWIPLPPAIEGVPPGLEYLTMVDTIVVQQILELVEVLTGFESKNKYSLRNANGQQVYFAAEESGCCARACCGNRRGFIMHIVDNYRREVIRVIRPFKCLGEAGCPIFEFCSEECVIESPPGQPIGRVVQSFACCKYNYSVRDSSDNEVFSIEGPDCCTFAFACCADKKFEIFGQNRDIPLGCIKKKYGGCIKESATDADTFIVNFPLDLDVRVKALLLGATFLIDFMAFESRSGSN